MENPPTIPNTSKSEEVLAENGFSSGEFQIPWLWSNCQRGIAVFKNKLHVMGSSYQAGDHYLAHATFDLLELTKKNPGKDDKGLELIDTKALKDPANWSQGNYLDPGVFFNNALSISLAANNTDLWAFYSPVYLYLGVINPLEQVHFVASKFNPVENSPGTNERWDTYDLLDAGGGTLIGMTGAASAKAFGERQFIVAAVRLLTAGFLIPVSAIYLGLYDTDDADPDGKTWKARASRWIDINSDIKYAVPNVIGALRGWNAAGEMQETA